jgi:hypothetical protein
MYSVVAGDSICCFTHVHHWVSLTRLAFNGVLYALLVIRIG